MTEKWPLAQYALVFDLNKCIGRHTCTIACKNLWTKRPGTEYMYWNNVETKPGRGYPKSWEKREGEFIARRPRSLVNTLAKSRKGVGRKLTSLPGFWIDYLPLIFRGVIPVQPVPAPLNKGHYT